MFGKKKDSDADLPELPMSGAPSMRDYQRTMLPPIESAQEEVHGLPSFPDSLMNKGFSQSMIKSAVEDEDKNLPELPEWNQEPIQMKPMRTMELDEWSPKSSMGMPSAPQRPTMADALRMTAPNGQVSDKRPLFVKLEKFKEARDSLLKISEKLDQMDELLRMIKDLKAKEDEEITSWEKDIESIKARILFINKEIFENAY